MRSCRQRMQVHVAQQHLDLAPDQQALESRVVDVHVVDVDLFNCLVVRFDPRQRRFDVGELALQR